MTDAGPVLKGIGGIQVRCRSPITGLGEGPVKDQVATGQGHFQLGGGIGKGTWVNQGSATRVLHEIVIDSGDWITAEVQANRAIHAIHSESTDESQPVTQFMQHHRDKVELAETRVGVGAKIPIRLRAAERGGDVYSTGRVEEQTNVKACHLVGQRENIGQVG